MSRTYRKILRNRKRRIERRLDPNKNWSAQEVPMFRASNIHYEMAGRTQAVHCGGIGAIHLMARKVVFRILSYNPWLPDFFATFEKLRIDVQAGPGNNRPVMVPVRGILAGHQGMARRGANGGSGMRMCETPPLLREPVNVRCLHMAAPGTKNKGESTRWTGQPAACSHEASAGR